ncbi:MAG: glutaredoxin 3 [Pseudomonadota bacterium]
MADAAGKPAVRMYATEYCSYCGAARMLLTKKGVAYDELLVSRDPALRDEMLTRSGRTSVPQIFIGDTHVGGFDDLYSLDASGELDKLLAAVEA